MAHLEELLIPWLHQCPLDSLTEPQPFRFSLNQRHHMRLIVLSLQPIYRKLPFSMNHIKFGSKRRHGSFRRVECKWGAHTSLCPTPVSIWCSGCFDSLCGWLSPRTKAAHLYICRGALSLCHFNDWRPVVGGNREDYGQKCVCLQWITQASFHQWRVSLSQLHNTQNLVYCQSNLPPCLKLGRTDFSNS